MVNIVSRVLAGNLNVLDPIVAYAGYGCVIRLRCRVLGQFSSVCKLES